MRNLKKILALVLALIMSLSLMATAGATDFSDADQITDDYAESVDVLNGLKVFQGYPSGDFQPQGEIKRSEVAVIIYRIATGDVDDSQVSIYKDYNKFSDVTSSHWAAGYINYCANAEYIKGRNAKTFDPEGKVTGYEALAMILRAVGYDKQGEFTGSNWHIQTAATGKQLGVTDKINSDIMLKQPATREMVAEILCKSILVPTVEYTAAFGYRDYTGSNTSDKNESLGYKTFKLERLEGVVTGNEYADLEAEGRAMNDDITRLVVGDRKLNLQVESYFGDIGESRYAYVVPTDKSEYTLVTSKLYDTGKNTITETGKQANSVSGATDGNTQYFVNYDQTGREWTSDIRIAYYIDNPHSEWTDFLEDLVMAESQRAYRRDAAGNTNVTEPLAVGYYRWIQPGESITPTDRAIIESIFNGADLRGTRPTDGTIVDVNGNLIVTGEVYVGTASTEDISDNISFVQFQNTYVKTDRVNITGNENGNYLKTIDNDNDGSVEYVLKTEFVLDQVAAVNGESVYFRGIARDATVRYETSEYKYDGYHKYNDTPTLTMGSAVVAAPIEGIWYAYVCEPKTATIKTVNFTNETATTTEDDEHGQSAIDNWTLMPDRVVEMSELVEYGLYIDLFGFIRAYDAPVSGRYALLTEMYPTGEYNVNFVRNIPWIAEMMTPGTTYPVENNVLNAYPSNRENVFIDDVRPWNYGVLNRSDYLQSAIAHLGLNSMTANAANPSGDGDNVQTFNATNRRGEFTWPTSERTESYTNVAKYTKADNGVYLYTASEFATDNGDQLYYGWVDTNDNDIVDDTDLLYDYDGFGHGRVRTVGVDVTAAANGMYKGVKFTASSWAAYVNRFFPGLLSVNPNLVTLEPVYAEDYIQLEVENITAGMRQYTMSDYNTTGYVGYVEAVNDTEFYVVGPNGNNSIRHFTGYSNMLGYAAEDIAAVYAVARNYSANVDQADYWVADVIVIELDKAVAYNSISLTYGNPSQTSAQIRRVDALNNETEGNRQVLYPNTFDWGSQLTGSSNYWFFGLTDTQPYEDGVKANLHAITRGRYNKNGIYAGQVISVPGNYGRGGYLSMDLNSDQIADRNHDLPTSYGDVAVPVYSITENGAATQLVLMANLADKWNGQVFAGDHLVWVYNSAGQVDFIVKMATTGWQNRLYLDIIAEQTEPLDDPDLDFSGIADDEDLKESSLGRAADENPAIDKIKTKKTMRLDYSDALEAWNEGDQQITLTITNAKQAFQSVTVQKTYVENLLETNNNWTSVPVTIDARKQVASVEISDGTGDMNSTKNVIWQITAVTTTDGVANPAVIYTVIREAADHGAEMVYNPDIRDTLTNKPVLDPVNHVIRVVDEGDATRSIKTFIKCFKPSMKGSIQWILTDAAGEKHVVTTERYDYIRNVYTGMENLADNTALKSFASIVAIVRDEDGDFNAETQVYVVNPPADGNYIVAVPDPGDPTIEVAEMIITANGDGSYTITVTLPEGKTPHLYKSVDAAQPQTTRAANGEYATGWTPSPSVNGYVTWTITINANPGDRFIVTTEGGNTPVDPDVKYPNSVNETVTVTGAAEGDTVVATVTYDKDNGKLTVTLDNADYEVKNITTTPAATVIKNADGTYTISGTDAEVAVTVEVGKKGAEPTEPTVTVTGAGEGVDTTSWTDYDKNSGKLTVDIPDTHELVDVKVDGNPVTAEADGSYTIPEGAKEIVVTVKARGENPPAPSGNTNNTDPVQADVNGSGAYVLSKYKGAAVTKEEAAAAIAKLAEVDVSAVEVVNNSTVRITKNGVTGAYGISTAADESMADPAELFQVKYNGEVWAYLPGTGDTLKDINPKYVVEINASYQGITTSSSFGSVGKTVDETTDPAHPQITTGALTTDVEYVDVVKVTTSSSSNVASITVGTKTETLTNTATVYIKKGSSMTVTSGTPTEDTTYQLVVDGENVGDTKTAADSATALKFEATNVTGGSDSEAAVAIVNVSDMYSVKIDGVELGTFADGTTIDLSKHELPVALKKGDRLIKRSLIFGAESATCELTGTTAAPIYTVASAHAVSATSKVIDLCSATKVVAASGVNISAIAKLDGANKSMSLTGTKYIARNATLTLAASDTDMCFSIKEKDATEVREWISGTTLTTTKPIGDKELAISAEVESIKSLEILLNDKWPAASSAAPEAELGEIYGLATDTSSLYVYEKGTEVVTIYEDAAKTQLAHGELTKNGTYTIEISNIAINEAYYTWKDLSLGENGAITVDSNTGTLVAGTVPTLEMAADGTYTITMTITPPAWNS